MSWLSGIAGKAEHLLNTLDTSASEALNHSTMNNSRPPIIDEPRVVRPADFNTASSPNRGYTNNTSGPKSQPIDALPTISVSSAKKKDRDEELLEFLNSSGPPTPQSKSAGHSRGSSISKTASDRVDAASLDDGIASMSATSTADGNATVSNPGQSAAEQSGPPESGTLASVELENKLLRSELMSLNQEVSSLLKRNHKSEEDLKRVRGQMEAFREQVRVAERELREVRSVEVDLTERLHVKDSQLLALRQEYDMARSAETRISEELDRLKRENASIRDDQSSSADVQSQALEDLRQRVQVNEAALEREKEAQLATQSENDRLRRSLEEHKMREAESLQQRSRTGSEEKRKLELLTSQHNVLRMKYDSLEKELRDYKEKASKILAMKEKIIAGLKSGEDTYSGNAGEGEVSEAEHAALRHERDLLREEVQRCKLEVERQQLELQEMEYGAAGDAEALRKSIELLEAENAREKQVRLDSQEELAQLRREHQYLQEKSMKTKTEFAERIASKESEIERLRGMLRLKANQSESTEELEARLRALTENLIQKQTAVDAANAEKHSLQVKLERVQAEHMSLERSHIALRANLGGELNMSGGGSLLPGPGGSNGSDFVRINMADAPLTRKVKGAVNTLDAFGIRLGVFLRRYPIARIFFIGYCVFLHLWVVFVLLTYQPEIHHNALSGGLSPVEPGGVNVVPPRPRLPQAP